MTAVMLLWTAVALAVLVGGVRAATRRRRADEGGRMAAFERILTATPLEVQDPADDDERRCSQDGVEVRIVQQSPEPLDRRARIPAQRTAGMDVGAPDRRTSPSSRSASRTVIRAAVVRGSAACRIGRGGRASWHPPV
jgi:hypothetical protein